MFDVHVRHPAVNDISIFTVTETEMTAYSAVV